MESETDDLEVEDEHLSGKLMPFVSGYAAFDLGKPPEAQLKKVSKKSQPSKWSLAEFIELDLNAKIEVTTLERPVVEF